MFIVTGFILITSIIMTIKTNPGGIPDDKEWDMQSDSNLDSESESDHSHKNATNTGRKSKE